MHASGLTNILYACFCSLKELPDHEDGSPARMDTYHVPSVAGKTNSNVVFATKTTCHGRCVDACDNAP